MTARSRANVPVAHVVDFRFAPKWWQTLICLPDDPEKILVGKGGELLLDPLSHDWEVIPEKWLPGPQWFATVVTPGLADATPWRAQETLGPRLPIVTTRWGTSGDELAAEWFLDVTEAEDGEPERPRRLAVLLLRLENPSHETVTRHPQLSLRSAGCVPVVAGARLVEVGRGYQLGLSEDVASLEPGDADDTYLLRTTGVELAPGECHELAVVVAPTGGRSALVDVTEAQRLRRKAVEWWGSLALPYDVIRVPDEGIQGLLESSVRNIWQARDVRDGFPAFHIGPTVYRDLFLADGAFVLELVAMLGEVKDARAGIEFALTHQRPDGRFELIERYWKENGLVLWLAARHARLTGDRDWLAFHWPQLQRVVAFIVGLRQQTLGDPSALEYGLLPGGYVDGGIGEFTARVPGSNTAPEYSNVLWCLAGLRAAVEAAAWIGDEDSAAAWGREYDDFDAAFRRAVERDLRSDPYGNRYLPTMMADAGGLPPQRGQWAFCQAVSAGEIFAHGDPAVLGTLNMLRDATVEGLVIDTGWLREGLWTYFASFFGHALLWEGFGSESADALYSFANHAGPTRVWREEQMPVGRGDEIFGDMPHNWASAEFIRLASHLLVLERGDELHLCEGLPPDWLRPGARTQVEGLLTRFGAVHLTLTVADDGASARLRLREVPGAARIVLHRGSFTRRSDDPSQVLPADRAHDLTIPL